MESFSSFRFMTLLILTHTMFFNFKPVGVVHVPQDLYTRPGNSSDLYTPSRNSSVSPPPPPPPPLLFPFPLPPPPPLPPSSVPALFVIGDSSVDCGTNNFLGTFARADRLPYGRDFDSHQPTGRFSNGRIPVDYLALHLGLPFVPSFLGQSGSVNDMKRGLNYASAGAGIIFSSGSELGQHISFTQQIQQVMDTFQRFILTMGEDAAASLITNSIFYISIGTNDYIHYYLPNVSDVQSKYVSWKFTQFLAQSMKQEIKVTTCNNPHLSFSISYTGHDTTGCPASTYIGTEIVINAIKIVTFGPTQKKWNKMGHGFALDLSSVQNDNLYNAKVRRVIVMGLAPIGCAPYYLWQYNSTNGECVKEINNMIMEFNFVLRYTVEELRKELKDANIIFCDAYLGSMDIMTKFDEYGFSVTKSACCGLGRYNGWIMCISPGMACENASNHLWWDQFHPTSAVNEILAENVWSGLHTKMCYPMNMEDMVAQRVSTHG